MAKMFPNSLPSRDVLSPTLLNRMARDVIEDTFPLVWVEGEISNFSKPASGHIYFTIKDAQAQVRCAMFRPKSQFLRFKPSDGMHVLLRGKVSLYEGRGEFQLLIDHIEEAGAGLLRRLFEELKLKLASEGLFDSALKRKLPGYPTRIGVVTSSTGAAIRDVIAVIRRRFPLVTLHILSVPVQGNEAVSAIVKVLQLQELAAHYDVLLLTRGGGSLEDLAAFNDESLARAIRASTVPVLSAIGHEIDITIADLVADLRAPTPSVAAELLVPDQADLKHRLALLRQHLIRCFVRKLENKQQRLDQTLLRLNARQPQQQLRLMRQQLDLCLTRLQTTTVNQLQRRVLRLGQLVRTLNAISPLATLERGYAILFDAHSGHTIRSIEQTQPQQDLKAKLFDGEVMLRVI